MFNFKSFSKDLGIDLGTANSLVYVAGHGIVIAEPSIVAINQKTGQILTVGEDAKKMVGRTPGYISAIYPLTGGVISDFEVTEQMLRYFFDKVKSESRNVLFLRPRVVIGVPCGATEVEKKAVEDAALSAGARKVFLIEEPLAAAIGARLPIEESRGTMIIDIGGGTAEIAVISLGGIVLSKSLRVAGNKLTDDIVRYVREEFKLAIGEPTAEAVKKIIGSASVKNGDSDQMIIRGRDLTTGLPKEMTITTVDVYRAMEKSIRSIVGAVKAAIDQTPPELVADIMTSGIYMSGGGSLLRNLNLLLSKETQVSVKIIDDSLTAVVRGTGIVVENIDKLKGVLLDIDHQREIRE